MVECNGEANHVNLLVNLPPKMTASKLVNPPQVHVLPQGSARSTPPSSATTGGTTTVARLVLRPVRGAPLSIVKQYIEQQNRRPGLGRGERCGSVRTAEVRASQRFASPPD
uniref:Transposase IS200-like domain-containing protein n=1 Tax=Streptomyces sp. NBC_00180 TaxID=2903632 RepID=A0AAU1IFE0_9ACTN